MRDKLINKLAILGLAAIFLLSMSSYAPADKGGIKPDKGDKEPPELYEVSISINGENPGIGMDPISCVSLGYVYAEKTKAGGKDPLAIISRGRDTLGLNGDVAPLNMWVKTGIVPPILLEQCPFNDGSHGETGFQPGEIRIRFLKEQDQSGPNADVRIQWWLDKQPANRKKIRLFRIKTLSELDWTDDLKVVSTTKFPVEGLGINDKFETDVIGAFMLIHVGPACPGGEEGVDDRILLPNFNIHMKIERIR